jgi:hypothetical protein
LPWRLDRIIRRSKEEADQVKAVFTHKPGSIYDDLPEERYHFPATYRRQVEEAVGDFIVYYEPRRGGSGNDGHRGRQAYVATARVVDIRPDPQRPDHFYAAIRDYIPFPSPVPFREGGQCRERFLVRADGGDQVARRTRILLVRFRLQATAVSLTCRAALASPHHRMRRGPQLRFQVPKICSIRQRTRCTPWFQFLSSCRVSSQRLTPPADQRDAQKSRPWPAPPQRTVDCGRRCRRGHHSATTSRLARTQVS